MFKEQLMRKEAELTMAEENIRREQQQMRQQVHDTIQWGISLANILVNFRMFVKYMLVVKASHSFSLYRSLLSYSNSCNPVKKRRRS